MKKHENIVYEYSECGIELKNLLNKILMLK